MMAGPGDETAVAAAGRGHLRASHADRDQTIDALKAAFVQGRLTKDEFDARVGQTLASRTYAELAAVTAGLPARPDPVPAAGGQRGQVGHIRPRYAGYSRRRLRVRIGARWRPVRGHGLRDGLRLF